MKGGTSFIGVQIGEYSASIAPMNFVHALVFFILISTAPAQPGPGKYGSQVEWVLYGAPSEQKARAWAQAQYDKMHVKDTVPQTVKEFLVLPMSDTLYTDKGPEPVPWTALPSWRDRNPDDIGDQELYSSWAMTIQPSPKIQAKHENIKDVTLEQLRASLDQETKGSLKYNWDESKSWYYIFYTSTQATLVKSVNMFAAGLPYEKAVRGTPAGAESVAIEVWQELTKYGE